MHSIYVFTNSLHLFSSWYSNDEYKDCSYTSTVITIFCNLASSSSSYHESSPHSSKQMPQNSLNWCSVVASELLLLLSSAYSTSSGSPGWQQSWKHSCHDYFPFNSTYAILNILTFSSLGSLAFPSISHGGNIYWHSSSTKTT